MALSREGDVYLWGSGDVNQLGNCPRDVNDFTEEERREGRLLLLRVQPLEFRSCNATAVYRTENSRIRNYLPFKSSITLGM